VTFGFEMNRPGRRRESHPAVSHRSVRNRLPLRGSCRSDHLMAGFAHAQCAKYRGTRLGPPSPPRLGNAGDLDAAHRHEARRHQRGHSTSRPASRLTRRVGRTEGDGAQMLRPASSVTSPLVVRPVRRVEWLLRRPQLEPQLEGTGRNGPRRPCSKHRVDGCVDGLVDLDRTQHGHGQSAHEQHLRSSVRPLVPSTKKYLIERIGRRSDYEEVL
jgi:hypothetical protein